MLSRLIKLIKQTKQFIKPLNNRLLTLKLRTMEENQELKKQWVTPEIVDLDVEKTAKSAWHQTEISYSAGPS